MLVAGFSGIGKTAVVNEVHKPITQQKGYFIKGKCDQFNRSIPFSAFVQAFRSLMGQLLGESDVALGDWKANILAAVGESGQVLIGHSYKLHYVESGEKAIGSLASIQPDLILLDIAMPGMDGVAVCEALKRMPRWQSIPIIMVTAMTTKLVLARCLETGADDFISKPVGRLELNARVSSMLRIRQ